MKVTSQLISVYVLAIPTMSRHSATQLAAAQLANPVPLPQGNPLVPAVEHGHQDLEAEQQQINEQIQDWRSETTLSPL